MTTYTQALLLLAPLLAVLFWAAAILLARQGSCVKQRKRRLGSVLWAAHVAVYWTTNAVLRLFFGYTAPTVWMSSWGTIIFVHAAISLLTMALLLRYESSPDSS